MDILWNILWLILALLPVVAGTAARRRIRREVGDGGSSLTDEDIRRIEATGRMEADLEPLDIEEIERAEREFWEESWDEPEHW
ncbi:MAG: hypothetical protein ACLFWG_10365 [Longimicrobiales bacterium]